MRLPTYLRDWCVFCSLSSLTKFQNESLAHKKKLQKEAVSSQNILKENLRMSVKLHTNATCDSGVKKHFLHGGGRVLCWFGELIG